MSKAGRSGITALRKLLLPIIAGMMCLAMPAQAQFSDSFKFLEAVKKKDGQKVEDAISEAGSTVINARDLTSGETALHLVTARRDFTWLRYLVVKGANVNLRDERGVSPLQLATNLGWLEGVEFLVERKADLDGSNDAGETPLITAVHRRDTAMMQVLLKGGADPDRADNSGRSARDYAQLDRANSQLASTIASHAKPREQSGGQTVYGPVM